MKLRNVILVSMVVICMIGFDYVGVAGQTANPSDSVSEWTADYRSCPAVTLDNVTALTQLAQIGNGEPHTVAWSPDGEVIALATGAGVHLFNGHTLQLTGILQSGYTKTMVWSGDGSLLALCASASAGDEIQVWDISTMEKKYSIAQKRTNSALYIDQEKNTLRTLGQQQTGTNQYGAPQYKAYLDTYNLKTGKKKEDSVGFTEKNKGLLNLSLSAKGTVVFGAGISEMYLWSAKGKLIYSASLSYPMYAFSVSGSDVSVVLDLINMKNLQIIDRVSKAKTSDVALPKSAGKMELNEDTQELLLYTQTGYLLFGLETNEILSDVSFCEKYTGDYWISGDRSRLVQIDNGTIKLFDLLTETLLGEQGGYDDRAWQVAISSNRLAAAKGTVWDRNTRLILWDLDTMESLAVTGAPEFSATISDVFFLPNETELVTYASGESTIKVWNAFDGVKTRDIELEGHLVSAKISAYGTVMAVGYGGVVGVFPLSDTSAETSFYMDSFVSSISLNNKGSRIAACDGLCLVVWDAELQSEVLTIVDDDVVAPVLSADGEQVAVLYSGDDGYIVKMLNVSMGKSIWKHTLTDNYQYMCFTPDGSMLAISAYEDGLIFLNTETGKEVYSLPYSMSDFSFSQDGRLLVTASSDGTIRVWGVTIE